MRLDDDLAPRFGNAGPRGDVVPATGRAPRRRPAWSSPVAVGAVTVLGTAVLALRSPHVSGSYGFCPFLAATGLWCPACGGLRAVHELAHLDVAAAWAMNPLVVVGVPVLVVAWGLWLAGTVGRTPRSAADRAVPAPRGPRTWPAWALLLVAVGFTVARNVPALEPWLAPV